MKEDSRGADMFTATEVGALIDEFRSEFRVFGEDLRSVKKSLKAISEQVGRNTEKIEMNRLLITRNQGLINTVLEKLKSKVDRTEFVALEKKVASLAH